jgi:hypothetical protein
VFKNKKIEFRTVALGPIIQRKYICNQSYKQQNINSLSTYGTGTATSNDFIYNLTTISVLQQVVTMFFLSADGFRSRLTFLFEFTGRVDYTQLLFFIQAKEGLDFGDNKVLRWVDHKQFLILDTTNSRSWNNGKIYILSLFADGRNHLP